MKGSAQKSPKVIIQADSSVEEREHKEKEEETKSAGHISPWDITRWRY